MQAHTPLLEGVPFQGDVDVDEIETLLWEEHMISKSTPD